MHQKIRDHMTSLSDLIGQYSSVGIILNLSPMYIVVAWQFFLHDCWSFKGKDVKSRGGSSAEGSWKEVAKEDIVPDHSWWLLFSCLGLALARREGYALAEVSEQLLGEVAWGAWVKISSGKFSSETLGPSTEPCICSNWIPDWQILCMCCHSGAFSGKLLRDEVRTVFQCLHL